MSSTNYTRNLYSKNALVRIVSSKPSEDRFRLIHITVDYQAPSIAAHKNELIIKLTDENDPFFLYSLYLNEDDYQSLKMSQGLLVDFSSFGEQLIGLLKGCEKEEKAENPR
jgi:spindle assembly abnormal protein 6